MRTLGNQRSGNEKVYKLRIVFMENANVFEFVHEIPNGLEIKYLPTLYKDIERELKVLRYQLLIVWPVERLTDNRIPIYITQDFDSCSVFSIESYFLKYNFEVKKVGGKVRRIKERSNRDV